MVEFEQNDVAQLFLYKQGDTLAWGYVTTIESATDDEGNAVFLISSAPGDEPANYGISFISSEGSPTAIGSGRDIFTLTE